MRPLKSPIPAWPFRYVNQHLSLKSSQYAHWNDGTTGGMPATRVYRACMGSELDWLLMCAVAAVKSDYWRKDPGDWFACGIGGAFDDQCINATIQWQNLTNTGDLKLTEKELQQVDLVYKGMLSFCVSMADAEAGQPLPEPPPPPPVVVVPPAPQPKPADPVPVPVEPPKAKPSWKALCATIAGVIGGGLFLAKLFLPGSIVLVLEAIKQILSALGS